MNAPEGYPVPFIKFSSFTTGNIAIPHVDGTNLHVAHDRVLKLKSVDRASTTGARVDAAASNW